MDNMINFGIDLGTTNSVIARFVKGEVQVYNNPTDQGRSSLPSVVGFKKDKIFIGAPARTLYERDPRSVVSAFKRRMGTTESYKIKATGQSATPVELSALVLKELKTFLPPGEPLAAAVITIPASFDMIQSNATKAAGEQAGIGQVVLLQEPIAASLAYANMKKANDLGEGQWLVYDLGGGTFDVALVRIKDGEMKVLDHEGDNFLGGTDFDRLIVEKLLVPKLEAGYSFTKLVEKLQSFTGEYSGAYQALLRMAEIGKISLSNKSSAEMEIERLLEDENGDDAVLEVTITQSEFNDIIKPHIDRTIGMVREILTRNKLQPRDLLFTLMVGGSTYIPFVRQRVGEALGTPVNCDIDPTTAVAVGAAYYAATKPREKADAAKAAAPGAAARLQVRTAYDKASRETETLFSAKITGNLTGLSYRITRHDGGYNSGLKPLPGTLVEDLPLVADAFNIFSLVVYDGQNNVVETDAEDIAINSGFSISGQPLPEDICLEIDDDERPGRTKSTVIFERMTPLPARRTVTRQLNRTVVKGSADEEAILINVREGSQYNLPDANKLIGHLRIGGVALKRDVQRGSDVEIMLEISESRDLTVVAYLTMIDQEFKGVFAPKIRATSVASVQRETQGLELEINQELQTAEEAEDYETAAALKKLRKEAADLTQEANDLTRDDVTDRKYPLEDRKRRLAQQLHEATRHKYLAAVRAEYETQKEECQELVQDHGNDQEHKYLADVVAQEPAAFSSGHAQRIQDLIDKLNGISGNILWRLPEFLTGMFQRLEQQAPRMNNPELAQRLVADGRRAVPAADWPGLRSINSQLLNLLRSEVRDKFPSGPMGH